MTSPGARDLPLNGKTALVTGGAGTIGTAICRAIAADGAHVIVADLNLQACEALANQIGGTGMAVDLAGLDELPRRIQEVSAVTGPIDILVNNAGILSNAKIENTDLEEWRRLHTINVDAAMVLCKALVPRMRQRKWGRIVSVSSYAAKCGGLTAGTAYTVSKSALIGLTFSVARECASHGITANAIAPAYVMSPMVSEQLSEEQRAAQRAAIPVGRFCEPEEVAHAVSFLASPLAGFITGEVIDMNGGLQFD